MNANTLGELLWTNDAGSMNPTLACCAGGTVNDVLVSVVTGAIRGHLVAHNQPVQDLFCAIPVSMRRPDDFDLRNESTMVWGASSWTLSLVGLVLVDVINMRGTPSTTAACDEFLTNGGAMA
jgi:hypothetical protein